ncbi:hypothetical protein V6Z05_19945 [Leptospira venezuelensis]|uniref:DUF7674 family protein n=1 Tax=Leptospira venezuelensis TaxID=1958811 RepID=UPI000A36C25F|nr:hypothetical protein [Leptospira venezuelensis]
MNLDFILLDDAGSSDALLKDLIKIFPNFQIYLDGSIFIEKKTAITIHGIFAEFSHYFTESFEKLSEEQLTKLFNFIEDSFQSEFSNLNNAVCTCFLENLNDDAIFNKIKTFFGKKTREYIQNL